MCKVSVIMPVCNAKKYISQSIQSIRLQTLTDIELICIDDASTDGTYEILKKYAAIDKRVQIIRFSHNQSALQARKAGVQAACGEYILFLDADDYYEKNACEKLYQYMKQEHAEILHFDSTIAGCGADKEWVQEMKRFAAPYYGKLFGADVFRYCFVLGKYQFNLWNKMFAADFIKQAFCDIPSGVYPKANDLLAYFILAYHAKSYCGIHTPGFYHYNFGRGSTGSTGIWGLSFTQFHKFCKEADVAKACTHLLISWHAGKEYQNALPGIKKRLLDECLYHWMEQVGQSESAQAFDAMAAAWGVRTTVDAAIACYGHRKVELANKTAGAACLKHTKKQFQTLGIFYHWMAKGGVQRVISLLIPMYLEMGYEVVLFTDEMNRAQEYPLPSQISRVILPSARERKDADYTKRGKMLRKALKEYGVDLMLYHAASSSILLLDALTVKSMGIPFVVTVHELFSQNMVYRDSSSMEKLSTYQLVDCLAVLSKAEQLYWEAIGIRAIYISNPTEKVKAKPFKKRPEDGYILWLGRLDQMQKQYMDAVKMMSYVVQEVPDAKLRIVGNQVDQNAVPRIRRMIRAYGLEGHVQLCGFTKDVGKHYKGAKMFLMTSAYESFPMTLLESKLWHLPLVTYEMPYLELLKDKRGWIC